MVVSLNNIQGNPSYKVFVSGDLMLDEYLLCREGFSKAENVKTLSEEGRYFFPGGTANVAQNLSALGGEVYLNGVIGKDPEGDILLDILDKKIDISLVKRDDNCPTTLKTRIINQDNGNVIRRDREKVATSSFIQCDQLYKQTVQAIHEADCVVISDYCKGALNPEWITMIINEAQKYRKPIIVDTKCKSPEVYSQVSVITPNLLEFGVFMNKKFDSLQSALPDAKSFLKSYGIHAMILKAGASGSMLVNIDQHVPQFCSFEVDHVASSIGAGDSLLAGFTAGICKGMNLKDAFEFGNWIASAVVSHPFTTVVDSKTINKFSLNKLYKHGKVGLV
ncbi:bifunctional heptose 7-phosphate kinase/heptose 1-phosphate adenyltransferase [Bacillus cereus]|uniref:bifunctional heptose 7-phosphate kinase/heptose 1-phosphate adenyltransferase n=1 Tax=Bacillus cereus TaxID=1396 RepID=UPI00065B6F18|nr:PfkB family carbohydrate kinase [Bacillus cereus]KMQ32187.1 hypothetical protein TU58_01495 [Bacillus cereus]